MSKKTLNLFLSLALLMLLSPLSDTYGKERKAYRHYSSDDSQNSEPRAYKPKFRKNYKRYKDYSPRKRKKMKKTWRSFKQNSKWQGLSPEEKKRLRERVLKKKRN